MLEQAEKERIEREFWENDPDHRPDVFSLSNLYNKIGEIPQFRRAIGMYASSIRGTVLELGGGQLFASCIVKADHPECTVFGSDIAPAAIAAAPLWEGIFRVKLDRTFTCTAHQIPLEAESVDLVFVFQAAHHFGLHEEALREVARVLRPGGVALYLSEPIASELTYKWSVERSNRMRPEVPEDSLVPARMKRFAKNVGLEMSLSYFDLPDRRLPSAIFHRMLRVFPPAKRTWPGLANLVFKKV